LCSHSRVDPPIEHLDDVTALGEAVGGNSAVGCAAEPMVAQLAGDDVISGVVRDLVVGLESVAAR